MRKISQKYRSRVFGHAGLVWLEGDGRTAQWIRKLQGLSDEPLLRAAQIALAAIDEIITADVLDDDMAVVAAYEALQTAIAERAEVVL
jgi:hypothetical protein